MSNYFKMILTGSKITNEVKRGNIVIGPFNLEQINPNSYDYRLGDELILFKIKGNTKNAKRIKIPETGYILKPGRTYLAGTYEILGSKKYAMSLIGKSSLGRLGLFLQVSANLGHTGSCHRWTLELVSAKQLKIYPNMIIGQISFWDNRGRLSPYDKGYSKYNNPKLSKLRKAK